MRSTRTNPDDGKPTRTAGDLCEDIRGCKDHAGTIMVGSGDAILDRSVLENGLKNLSRTIEPSLLRLLRLTSSLQVTLDLEKLLSLFSKELSSCVPHEGLSYENDRAGISMEFGNRSTHSCQYELIVSGDNIGSITITRDQAFDDTAIREFEHLLCGLVYPLLNALLFRDAVESAHRDPLTRALNRLAMVTFTSREIDFARRQNTPLALLMMDLDNFKTINDQHGHAAGDAVIRQVAQSFLRCVRKSDLLFRYGGDEFTVLMSNCSLEHALVVVGRLLTCVQRPFSSEGSGAFNITASIGVATLRNQDDYSSFVQRADQAMYCAKAAGGNQYCIDTDLERRRVLKSARFLGSSIEDGGGLIAS